MTLSEEIIHTITKNPHNKVGINFLYNFLNDSYDEKVINGQRCKFYLINKFNDNVRKLVKEPNIRLKMVWERYAETGDVRSAFINVFDWKDSNEGFDFWAEIQAKYLETYDRAVVRGMMPTNDIANMSTNDVWNKTEEKTDSTMPSSLTLKFMSFLMPNVKHERKEVEIFIDVLKREGCIDAYFANLRNKPKKNGYEEKFKSVMYEEAPLFGILYWSFDWYKVEEGYTYWDKINTKINNALRQEVMFRFDIPEEYRQPPHHSTPPSYNARSFHQTSYNPPFYCRLDIPTISVSNTIFSEINIINNEH